MPKSRNPEQKLCFRVFDISILVPPLTLILLLLILNHLLQTYYRSNTETPNGCFNLRDFGIHPILIIFIPIALYNSTLSVPEIQASLTSFLSP